MVKKNDENKQTTTTISSIVERLREVVRENDAKIGRAIKSVTKTVETLRGERKAFADRVESVVADIETFASKTIAEERARDDAIREASIFDEEGGSPPQTPRDLESEGGSEGAQPPRLTREGRAAISFLVSKFEEICERFDLDLEVEHLDEIHDLRKQRALTDERERLEAIAEAFEHLQYAYDALGSTWLSGMLEQNFAQETMDVEETEIVTDVETFVRDQLMDLESPTVADVLRLDTHEKTREFAEYLNDMK